MTQAGGSNVLTRKKGKRRKAKQRSHSEMPKLSTRHGAAVRPFVLVGGATEGMSDVFE